MSSPALDMTLRISREDFLKEEVLCGFCVTAKMKKVFKLQMDMLEIVQDICKRHGLNYLLCGGSLLGAVRHKGYIPWDDDIDITMLRPDYDKFVEIASKELREPYFLQTALSDPNRTFHYAKLRNSNTTAIAPSLTTQERESNQGIFIDIFPVDGVPDSPSEYRREVKMLSFITSMMSLANVKKPPVGFRCLKWIFAKFIHKVIGIKRIYAWRECIYRKYPVDRCQKAGQISFFGLKDCTNIETNYFKDAVIVPFEYLYARIPRDYDYVLTAQYGDWHKSVKGTQYHDGVIFDPDTPYKVSLERGIGVIT